MDHCAPNRPRRCRAVAFVPRPWLVLPAVVLVAATATTAAATTAVATTAVAATAVAATAVAATAVAATATTAVTATPTPSTPAKDYFQIQVCDRATGRGVPLVQLTTTNRIPYVTDSAGRVAFYEPGLMDREVFFEVTGHGYTYPKDGFGFRGVRLRTTPGASAVIHVDRTNIAERLYRITGQGIYRDTVLLGLDTPITEPVLNAQVMGQDSVQNCWYRGRLYWFWGDTQRPSYPLGHFAMAGAVSRLPSRGGLDPAVGVDLEYFTDAGGFSRPMAPLSEPGPVWLDGLFTVPGPNGRERMLATYARMKNLGEAAERGLMVFDDDRQQFVRRVRGDRYWLLYSASGHPFAVRQGTQRYWYFATPFPLAVRMRVRADWSAAVDPGAYEILTAAIDPAAADAITTPDAITNLVAGETSHPHTNPPDARWIPSAELLRRWSGDRNRLMAALKKEKQHTTALIDIETGQPVVPHNGSVFWNAYRHRWIMIAVQQGGDASYLGEVWYAEADTPTGPWAYARRIVTHDHYTFYNPKQHPYFDQQGGRIVFFEGTYAHTFSQAKTPTPRYDYNQIMYRLDLADTRLTLPVPIYEIESPDAGCQYLTAESLRARFENPSPPGVGVHPENPPAVYPENPPAVYPENPPAVRSGIRPAVRSENPRAVRSAFYAVDPARAAAAPQDPPLIPVYTTMTKAGPSLVTDRPSDRPSDNDPPVFFALPPDVDMTGNGDTMARLFEYRHKTTGRRRYAVESPDPDTWDRADPPLCTVWKAPTRASYLDWTARPAPPVEPINDVP